MPAAIERALAAKRDGATHWMTDDKQLFPIPNEIEEIAAMVIPLDPAEGVAHYYTCKNLLPNGDCGIYQTRPVLCSAYPYGRTCRYSDCTWDAVRQRLDVQKEAGPAPTR